MPNSVQMTSKSIVFMLILIVLMSRWVVDVFLYFVRFLKLLWISFSAKYTRLIVCALHQHDSCVNPLGIALGQSHSNFMLFYLETLLIPGLFISWGVKLFSRVKIQRIHRVHITVHMYCLITCNVKSLLNVRKTSHPFISKQFPRFPNSRQNLQIPGINLFFSRNSPY